MNALAGAARRCRSPWAAMSWSRRTGPAAAGAGRRDDASVDDISNDATKFYGKTVRVVEDVARVLAPRIFTLDEETPLGMGKDVMVVAPKGVTVREDEDVEVVGVVREFTWTELEKEKFDFDLKREWQMEFKSRPVIYATSVRQAKTD